MEAMNISAEKQKMRTFEIWFEDGDGLNHRLYEASHMSVAVFAVEQEGKVVKEARERE